MNIPIAGQPLATVLIRAQFVLGPTQQQLGDIVGVNRRTVWRWQSGASLPSANSLATFARLAYPKDVELAVALAAATGNTLESLGIVAPSPVLAPSPPAPAAAGLSPTTTRLLVDAVVCAAADALDASPRAVRSALFAAFACAREAGLSLETVEKALAPAPQKPVRDASASRQPKV